MGNLSTSCYMAPDTFCDQECVSFIDEDLQKAYCKLSDNYYRYGIEDMELGRKGFNPKVRVVRGQYNSVRQEWKNKTDKIMTWKKWRNGKWP